MNVTKSEVGAASIRNQYLMRVDSERYNTEKRMKVTREKATLTKKERERERARERETERDRKRETQTDSYVLIRLGTVV